MKNTPASDTEVVVANDKGGLGENRLEDPTPAEGKKKPKLGGKAGFLLKVLDDRITSFQSRRKENRSRSFRLKITSSVFSAMTTVFLGIQVGNETVNSVLKISALFLSAFVTVFTGWEAFFDHKGLWVKYTRARAQLLALKAELEYMLAAGETTLPDEKVDPLFLQYQQILEETNSSWLQMRSEDAHKHTKPI